MFNPPIVTLGFVQGDVREETWDKSYTRYNGHNRWLFNTRPVPHINIGSWQVTHIQYKSWFGFLIYRKPWSVHAWIQLRKPVYLGPPAVQQTYRVPGSEVVIYRRIGWRWDEKGYHFSAYINFSLTWD